MLKRIGALLLVLTLLMSFAACTPAPEPEPEEVAFEAYSHIMQHLSIGPGLEMASGAYDMDFVMQIDMRFLGEEVSQASSGNIKMIVDGDNMESAMTMYVDMGELGSSVVEMYMALEGTTLTEMQVIVDGEEMPAEFFPQEMFQEMLDSAANVPDFHKDALLSAEIEEVGENSVMHMVLDGQMLADFVMDSMDDMLASLGEDAVDMNVEIEDIVMTITTDSDDNPLAMTMEMHMQMEVEGEEVEMSISMEYTFNAFGEEVEVEMFV